jgi:hypothetical protein
MPQALWRTKHMREAILLLISLALPGSAAAQFEFLTVKEIFEVIDFVADHPAAPADFKRVSPFGPDASETRMPEIFADLAGSILQCYHQTARYQLADIRQTPWDRQGQYGGDDSALIRIRYFGAISDHVYEMDVALVSRHDQIRAAVLTDNSPVDWNANCQLEQWTTLKP